MADHNSQTSAEPPFEPAAEFEITSLDTLKVFADPLRQKLIEAMTDQPRTVKQVAGELDLAPTKLYYHINLLEEHGLIRVTDTRVVSGIIEKQYRASASSYAIRRSLLTPGSSGSDGLQTALDAMIAPMRDEITRGVQNGVIDTSEDAPIQRKLRIWRAFSKLTPEEAEAFYERLEALVTEFDAKKPLGDKRTSAYTLVVGIYPTQQTPAE